MDHRHPSHPSFSIPETPRREITQEPSPTCDGHDKRGEDVSWISHRQQGGGAVPHDYQWTSNPQQEQEDTRTDPENTKANVTSPDADDSELASAQYGEES